MIEAGHGYCDDRLIPTYMHQLYPMQLKLPGIGVYSGSLYQQQLKRFLQKPYYPLSTAFDYPASWKNEVKLDNYSYSQMMVDAFLAETLHEK